MYEFENAWNVLMLYLNYILNTAKLLPKDQFNKMITNEKIITNLNKVIEIFNKFEQRSDISKWYLQNLYFWKWICYLYLKYITQQKLLFNWLDPEDDWNVIYYEKNEVLYFRRFLQHVRNNKWLVDIGSIYFKFWYIDQSKAILQKYKDFNPTLTEITDKDYIMSLKFYEGVSQEFSDSK